MDWEMSSTISSSDNLLVRSKEACNDDLLDINVIHCDKETDLINKLLNDKSMSVHTKNSKNETMLHVAAKNGIEKLVSLLIEELMKCTKKLENVVDRDGLSTFHILCMGPNSYHVKKFLDLELVSNIDFAVYCEKQINCAGYSPVHFAAEYYRLDTLKLLIQHGASVKARHINDLTPMLLVCKQNTERLIYQAVEEMNCKEFCDDYQNLMDSRIKMLDLLVKNDRDIDTLHFCAALGHIVKKQAYTLNSYISYCKSIGYHQYEPKLNYYQKHESNISLYNKYARSELIKIILNSIERDEGFTILHWLAANFGPEVYDENIIQIVIEDLDGNANAADENLSTPLHIAAKLNNHDFIKHLFYLEWSAVNWNKHIRIDAQDNKGNTALHYICLAPFFNEEQYESMTLILNNGADFTVPNNEGITVLSIINDAIAAATDFEIMDVVKYYVATANDRLTIYRLHDWFNVSSAVFIAAIWGHLERQTVLTNKNIIDETNHNHLFQLYRIFHLYAPLFFLKFHLICFRDIAKLKELHFGTSFTLYDMLVKDIHKIAFYTENNELKNVLTFYDANLCNSLFKGLLKARFIKSCARKSLLDEANVAFTVITKSDIPELCLEKIFCYLNDDDLKALIEACK